ncbi:MAG: hypothetical protein ACLSB9_08225 [Hydrogeniiclostridium mannosilyticum]
MRSDLPIIKYIGAYTAAMGGLDCIVLPPAWVKTSRICAIAFRGLKYLGVRIDGELNDQMVSGKEGKISAFDSHVPVYVINTNEELVIARDTKTIVEKLEYASTEDKTVVDLEDI